MERTIRVTGKGRLSVKPDTVRLILSCEGRNKDYNETMDLSAKMTNEIRDIIVDLGFCPDDLKTLSLGTETEYEYYEDSNRYSKRRFVGYMFYHRMKLEFPSDNKIMGKLLFALGNCEARPEMSIEYTVKDTQKAKDKLVKNACRDAKKKAALLCSSLGTTLCEIISVDYSFSPRDITSGPSNRFMKLADEAAVFSASGSIDMDISADNIDIEDNVTVVFRIE